MPLVVVKLIVQIPVCAAIKNQLTGCLLIRL